TFRKLLGVDEDKYETMREFTRNVINPAIAEVNERADFKVNIEKITMGKKITGFEVFVENKKNKQISIPNIDDKKSISLISETFGNVNENVLSNISKNYSMEYINEKIKYTKE